MADIAARLADLDWTAIERSLWEWGYAKTPPVLTPEECAELIALYDDDARFRSRVDMARYRFGLGEYKYFAAPLPPLVQALRTHAYPPLAAVANRGRPRSRPRRCIPPCTRGCWSAVTAAGRRSRPRCCCTTRPAATIACTRTSTAMWCSHCSSRAS